MELGTLTPLWPTIYCMKWTMTSLNSCMVPKKTWRASFIVNNDVLPSTTSNAFASVDSPQPNYPTLLHLPPSQRKPCHNLFTKWSSILRPLLLDPSIPPLTTSKLAQPPPHPVTHKPIRHKCHRRRLSSETITCSISRFSDFQVKSAGRQGLVCWWK